MTTYIAPGGPRSADEESATCDGAGDFRPEPAGTSEPARGQLAHQLLEQRRRVELGRPADLRPVIGLDLAQHLAPALRVDRHQAVVLARALGQPAIRRAQERVQPAARRARDDA